MPDAGKVEAVLGVAIAKMETAKRDTLLVLDEMYPHMWHDGEQSSLLGKLFLSHSRLEVARNSLLDAAALIHPKGERFEPSTNATAHPEVQPGTLVNPINKVLLEALKRCLRLLSDEGYSDVGGVIAFSKQAVVEAEKGLVENLGSSVLKGSDTGVRRDSLLQTLRDIKIETEPGVGDGWAETSLDRIATLVDDVLAKAEGR